MEAAVMDDEVMNEAVMDDAVRSLEAYFDRLWPMCRSIMGPGYRDSLAILDELMPTTKRRFKTGQKVLDWTVPDEWEARDAYIIDPEGKKICDFTSNNLHLVSHSEPVERSLSLEALQPHLHSLPDQPEAIPYVTSYYNRTWGFCLSHHQRETLVEGVYRVFIDACLQPGELVIGQALIKGTLPESDPAKKRVLFSSYLCHPSMANNELSGPLVLSHLYRALNKKKSELKHDYYFYIFPETIGSIALLSELGPFFKDHLDAGYHLSCIGDGGPLTLKCSRQGNTAADAVAYDTLRRYDLGEVVNFNPAFGSDERQYCAPGFNLPVASVMRTMYTHYPEYHTSLDNKTLMDFKGMAITVNALAAITEQFEDREHQGFHLFRSRVPYGEPQLSKRGLFRSLSVKNRESQEIAMWWMLNYCDGQHDLFKIAMISDLPVSLLYETAQMLVDHGLLEKIVNKDC